MLILVVPHAFNPNVYVYPFITMKDIIDLSPFSTKKKMCALLDRSARFDRYSRKFPKQENVTGTCSVERLHLS